AIASGQNLGEGFCRSEPIGLNQSFVGGGWLRFSLVVLNVVPFGDYRLLGRDVLNRSGPAHSAWGHMIRRECRIAIVTIFAAWLAATTPTPARADAAFRAWVEAQWPAAQAQGVSRETFDLATRRLEPDLSLPDLEIPGRPERPQPGQAE